MINNSSMVCSIYFANNKTRPSKLAELLNSPHYIVWLNAFILLAITALYPLNAVAENEGNCLMCHQMKGLVITDEESKRPRNLTIEEDLYKASYHGRVKCKGCHSDIEKIPHGDVEPVNCANDCHIRDPSTNSRYSHSYEVNSLKKSAHGKMAANSEHTEDLPVCKDCHSNKPYQKSKDEQKQFDEFKRVCLQCHESVEWIERFYKHMKYRTSTRRSSKDIVKLCSQCHADGAMMGRHDLEVVIGFNDTFHGKAIQYGNKEVANCLNCHAPYVEDVSPHSILSKDKIDSPVSSKNKIVTCRQSGCHVGASEEFASNGKVHPSSYGMVSWMRPKQTTLETLRSDQYETSFQELVIFLIKMFYKVLIALVVGGLGLHQLLSYLTIRREIRENEV